MMRDYIEIEATNYDTGLMTTIYGHTVVYHKCPDEYADCLVNLDTKRTWRVVACVDSGEHLIYIVED